MILEGIAKRIHADKIYRQPATLLARIILWTIAGYGIFQGVFIAATSPVRWSGPTYYIVRGMANYYLWAYFALFFGLVVLIGSLTKQFYIRAIGHMGLAFWNMAFCVGTVYSFNVLPTAGNTAPSVYAFGAVMVTLMICIDESDPSEVFYGRKHEEDI